MSEIVTTSADAVRDGIVAAIRSIVPRYPARKAERFVFAEDQEIPAGARFRLFDVQLGPESEEIGGQFGSGGWYGGGVEYGCDVEIRVSYPLATPLATRFAGADHQDLAGVLVDLHTTIPGMFAMSASGPGPVLEPVEVEGDSGRHVAVYRCRVTFFASDEVERT